MGQAWPRFLPGSTAEAIAHALMIEAHQRAMAYAQTRYRPEEIRAAWNVCATAAGNSNILLHFLTTFVPAAEDRSEHNRLAA